MNYVNTFIEVSADCEAKVGTPPRAVPGRPTIAQLEYGLISQHPYRYTQEDVQFHVHAQRTGLTPARLETEGDRLRAAFFSKPMACMRASPLPKSYGWGLHFDEQARVALVSAGTDDYNRLADDPMLAHTRAMRNKRAAD